ncbi:MAG: Dyp-type peroxidase [Tessaracoccus sp.]|uniref:Dyp-type peroxidase n=1 Tax=Tessaracoccus sp. TaxID=1971211 RepID=UPI001ED1B3FD|nr:Dyp-type peroxidase [Tessaracoccus sp.]MBK7819870.1 Dyp-type peroxidase [Tessaracoccus sp.]
MTRPQAILHPLPAAALFLVLTVRQGGEDVTRGLLADVPALRRAVGFRVPNDRLEIVVGVGSDAWGRLFSGPRPAGLHPFMPLDGGRHSAPSTPGDLLFHIRAATPGPCFELGRVIMDRLRSAADVVDETHGFRYFEQRDLLGFVDGTENPEEDEAAEAALVGGEDPAFAGGSYVVVQKYLHDMSAWNALSVGEQERVIGRTKMEDIEMPDDVKPANSHIALNDLPEADDGRAREILRSNMPFGELGTDEFGTYFIGYAGHPEDIELMLENMFIGFPPGNTDRILDFSTAVTGSMFYCPTVDFLEDQPPSPSLVGEPAAPEPTPAVPDGSLGIGALGRNPS